MKKLILSAFLICVLFQEGCIAAAATAVAATATSKRTRAKWNDQFNQNNLEREKAGLKPLDWCEEAFKVNKGWATDDKACKAQLKRAGKI